MWVSGRRWGAMLGGGLALSACVHSRGPEPLELAARQEVNRGTTAYLQGDLGTAEAAYRQALALDPQESEAGLGLGAVLLRTERELEAEAVFLDLTRAMPRSSRAFTGLGLARAAVGAHPAAVEALEKAIALDPEHAEAYLGLGLVYLELGDTQKVLEVVRRLEAVDSEQARKLKEALNPF